MSTAKKNGLRFQRKAEKWIKRSYGDAAHIGEWIEYVDASGQRWCQPDAWVVGQRRLAVFEVKVNHSELAWWQLTKLYAPLLSQLYGMPVVPIELVRSYDPLGGFTPEQLCFSEEELMEAIVRHDASFRPIVFQWRV